MSEQKICAKCKFGLGPGLSASPYRCVHPSVMEISVVSGGFIPRSGVTKQMECKFQRKGGDCGPNGKNFVKRPWWSILC